MVNFRQNYKIHQSKLKIFLNTSGTFQDFFDKQLV